VVRNVERTGQSSAVAEIALKAALRDRERAARDGEINNESTVRQLGELWLAEIDRAVRLGKRSPSTAQQYHYRFDRHVRDGLGALRVRELSVSRLDRLVVEVHDRFGTAAAKTTRTVLSGMIGLAVRYDVLERNLVRDVGRIESGTSSARALTIGEARDLRAKLHADQRCRDWGLVDFTDFMLATGLRIGEAPAMTWAALDLDSSTAEVRGTVVRITGEGLMIKPRPKSKSDGPGRAHRSPGGRPARPLQGVDDTGQLLRPEGRSDRRGGRPGGLRHRSSETHFRGYSGGRS
jgi:integrase